MNRADISTGIGVIDADAHIVEGQIKSIIGQQCSSLDKCIDEVGKVLKEKDFIPDNDLEYYVARLPQLLYWAMDALAALELKSDLAQMRYKSALSTSYLGAEGNASERKLVSESETLNEKLISITLQNACNQVQSRINMGTEMLQCLKKIMTKRMSEYNITDGGISNNDSWSAKHR